jgi:hypothetical protein
MHKVRDPTIHTFVDAGKINDLAINDHSNSHYFYDTVYSHDTVCEREPCYRTHFHLVSGLGGSAWRRHNLQYVHCAV